MQSRKHTAWKKNRKLGDVMGGRKRPKLTDNIFNRLHNLPKPVAGEETPIYITDNTSRDFYFPVTVEEIKAILSKLPREDTMSITHIWLRKIKKTAYMEGGIIQGCFVQGSGVSLVILYPFPTNNKMWMGAKKPDHKNLNQYKKYNAQLITGDDGYWLQWDAATIKQYYLNNLLLFQIGSAVDSYYKRWWSKAKRNTNFSDGYAKFWGDKICATEKVS